MNTPCALPPLHQPHRALVAALLLSFLSTLPLAMPIHAQTAPAPAKPATPAKAEEAVVLSPFEVSTDKDTSYGALNSNSISAINMELFKTRSRPTFLRRTSSRTFR